MVKFIQMNDTLYSVFLIKNRFGKERWERVASFLPDTRHWIKSLQPGANRTIAERIENFSRIHPNYVETFANAFYISSDIMEVGLRISNYMHTLLSDTISNCDRVAAILPLKQCLRILDNLVSSGYTNVYIGQEKLNCSIVKNVRKLAAVCCGAFKVIPG